jgi:hypothetical protein
LTRAREMRTILSPANGEILVLAAARLTTFVRTL